MEHILCLASQGLSIFECHITSVYAPKSQVETRLVWEELADVRGLMDGPWAICGDFNVCKFPSEKRDCSKRNSAMREFSDCIEDMDLVDPQLGSESYTWYKGDNHTTASRIDRILVSIEWNNLFNILKQTTFAKSDFRSCPYSSILWALGAIEILFQV